MINHFILLLSMTPFGLAKPHKDVKELEFWQGMVFGDITEKKSTKESVPINSESTILKSKVFSLKKLRFEFGFQFPRP